MAGWLFPFYLALIFIGFILLRTPGATSAGQELGVVRAVFTSVNAATLTGFPQTIQVDSFRPLGQGAVFLLIVCGSVFSLVIGGTAMTRILRLGYSDRQILRAVLSAEAAAIGLGTFFLLFDKERTVWQAIFTSASAFGNAGLILGPPPGIAAWQTQLGVLPLIVCGGLGICVLMEVFDRLRGRTPAISAHARTVLGMTAWMYIGGTILLMILNWTGEADAGALRSRLVSSSAAAVASRTGGMGLVEPERMTRAAVWGVMLLMAVGGASGGAAGGIKTSSLVEVFRGVRGALLGRAVRRSFGIAACWVGMYLLLVLVSLLLLLRVMPQIPADRVLFLAVSAASNVGLSHEPLSPDPLAAFVLSGTMIVGRFAPMMVIWWMADTTKDAELAVG